MDQGGQTLSRDLIERTIYKTAIGGWCCSVAKSCLILCDPKDYSHWYQTLKKF